MIEDNDDRKIQEEAKAKVKMKLTEKIQEGTDHNMYKCSHDGVW